MSKKWIVVLSDGTTWELVSPGIRLYSVEDVGVAEVGDRLREITDAQEGIALVDLLAKLPARIKLGLVHMPENRTRDLGDHEGVVLTYETLRVVSRPTDFTRAVKPPSHIRLPVPAHGYRSTLVG